MFSAHIVIYGAFNNYDYGAYTVVVKFLHVIL